MNNIKIAVIGKSSAGKSAFIRSFSSRPEYINSVGKGQTTRAYAEYLFLKKYDYDYPFVEATIATLSHFSENRVGQVLDKFKKEINTNGKQDVFWIREQFENKIYDQRIKKYMLYSDDFFNIKEFLFLNENIIDMASEQYEIFKKSIFALEQKVNEGESETENKSEQNDLEKELEKFFNKIYEMILLSIEERYGENNIYIKENNMSFFKFYVDEEKKDIFSLLLKVDENKRSSLTGIITKVRVSNKLSLNYKSNLDSLDFENITLIDTYGLDHSESIDKEILVERYNKIFNKDYPDISTVFLVEALHAGASNEFKKAITTLYEVKPEIMTYVVGTYIDENEKNIINNQEWLFLEDKTLCEAPHLNGKVLQILEDQVDLQATLLDQGITETMAEKRCEVMQKRFAPFCGDVKNNSGVIDYEKVNNVSIKALFLSVLDKEHLGDGFIEIDKIMNGIIDSNILVQFSKVFVDNVTTRFRQIYKNSASRTRWRIRWNLQRYILGFDGTTLDATWVRVFRDAFNQTFTKKVSIDEDKLMLSETLDMEGNSKIAFDEIIAMIYSYIFKRKCNNEIKLNSGVREIDCSKCAIDKANKIDCLWNIFINKTTYEMFGKRDNYDRVIDWLNDLHKFSDDDKKIVDNVTSLFKAVIEEQLIPMCRERNAYIISKKIKQSEKPYASVKQELYENYKEGFDKNVDENSFYNIINAYLSHCS